LLKVALDARLIAGTNTGDSTYWSCLLNALLQVSPETEFALITNTQTDVKVPLGANARTIHTLARSGAWWSLVKFPLAARKLGSHVTHTQYSLSPLIRNGITTIHDVSFFIGPEWFTEKDRNNLQKRIPVSVKIAKRIITVSDTSRKEMHRFLPESREKIRVAHNACPDWVQPSNDTTALTRLSIKPPYVLTVGTQWDRKNMNLAVTAMRLYNAQPGVIPHKLVVTGKFRDKINDSHVVQTGYVDQGDLNSLYSQASLYLAPSLHEGFGIPILEAFRCGTPVLCGYGGAMPEVAGDAGLVASDYAAETWAGLIQELLNNPSKLSEMRERGYAREKEFTWEKSARVHLATYSEIAQGNKTNG
jgi:glycosyltransferase involved in cell wall biosynthesis